MLNLLTEEEKQFEAEATEWAKHQDDYHALLVRSHQQQQQVLEPKPVASTLTLTAEGTEYLSTMLESNLWDYRSKITSLYAKICNCHNAIKRELAGNHREKKSIIAMYQARIVKYNNKMADYRKKKETEESILNALSISLDDTIHEETIDEDIH
jgi:hypothetical protein